jgi:Rrf2 family iron-sulfur cluster assembly transcriptional regulator
VFSPTCKYAIRALTCLARHEGEGPLLARRIADAEDIPRQFLSKILHHLRTKGLVRSQKGPGGGFSLARSAGVVTVAEVVAAVDGVQPASRRCLLGHAECSDATGCALHETWSRLRGDYERALTNLTLRDLAAGREHAGAPEEPHAAAPGTGSAAGPGEAGGADGPGAGASGSGS